MQTKSDAKCYKKLKAFQNKTTFTLLFFRFNASISQICLTMLFFKINFFECNWTNFSMLLLFFTVFDNSKKNIFRHKKKVSKHANMHKLKILIFSSFLAHFTENFMLRLSHFNEHKFWHLFSFPFLVY